MPKPSVQALGLSEQATQYLNRLAELTAQTPPVSSHSVGGSHNSRKNRPAWTPERWNELNDEQKQIATTLPTLSSIDFEKYEGMSKDQLREECVSRGLRKKGVPLLVFADVLKTRLTIYERSGKSNPPEGIDSSGAKPSSTKNSLDIAGEMAKLTFNGRIIIWSFQEWESLAPDDRRAVTTLATSSREDFQKYGGMGKKELKLECKVLGLPVSKAHKLALRDILKARLLRYAKSNGSSKIIDSLPYTQIPENHVNNNNEVSRNTRKEFHTMSEAELNAECTRHGLSNEGARGVLLARLTLNACATCGKRGHSTPQCRNSRHPPRASPHVQRNLLVMAPPPPPPVASGNNAANSHAAAHSWSVPGAGKLPIDDHAERICNYVATHRVLRYAFRYIPCTFEIFA